MFGIFNQFASGGWKQMIACMWKMPNVLKNHRSNVRNGPFLNTPEMLGISKRTGGMRWFLTDGGLRMFTGSWTIA